MFLRKEHSLMIGRVHSIESFGTVDGPGIRMVIFLSGCPMRCLYCHNPDTWDPKGGTPMTAEDILNQYEQARPFYKKGGITVSGGEPLMQIGFVTELFEKAKKSGIHTCLDTSGHLGANADEELLANTDLVLLDIKAWNPERYRALAGGELRPTLEFAERLAALRKPVWLRYVLVPGLTDNMEDITELSRHAARLGNVERVDVLPFHQMGRFKWDELKLDYTLKDVPEPSEELTEQVRDIFRQEENLKSSVH